MILEGKVAIVTGSARGIGAEIALLLGREGADIVGCDVNYPELEQLLDRVKSYRRQVLAFKTDISNSRDVQQMISSTMEKFGKIDILVNNAAISSFESLEESSEKDWEKMLDVNLKGTFICSKAVIPIMKKQKYGKIVNITSLAGEVGGIESSAPYSASKAGVICFTKTLAKYMASFNVNVNAVAPAMIQTHMIDVLPKERIDAFIQKIPLGRLGKPKEVAEVVLFLASEKSDWITGETVNINGGLFMG
jgi:3-oxoacyl-[acyl-carrier protein] reductase